MKPDLNLFYTLHVSILGSDPLIWRRMEVPGITPLSALDLFLREGMGWMEDHLSLFRFGGKPLQDSELRDWLQDRVGEGDVFEWIYDMGDNWAHEIRVEAVRCQPGREWFPVLTNGARSCPPDDYGGIFKYNEYARHWDDPSHPLSVDMKDWLDTEWDPELFSLEEAAKPFGYFRDLRFVLPFEGVWEDMGAILGQWSINSVVAIMAHADFWTPVFMESLGRVLEKSGDFVDEDREDFPLIALYLLAGMRKSNAGSLAIQFASLDVETRKKLFPKFEELDEVDEWGGILATIHQENPEPLFQLAWNPEVAEISRIFAVEAVGALYAGEALPRENVLEFLRDCFDGRIGADQKELWGNVLMLLEGVHPGEFMAQAGEIIQKGWVDVAYLDLVDLEAAMGKSVEECFLEYKESMPELITDLVQTLTEILGHPKELEPPPRRFERSPVPIPDYLSRAQHKHAPLVRSTPKVGRNDPCPCGSGKKYKKCCGA